MQRIRRARLTDTWGQIGPGEGVQKGLEHRPTGQRDGEVTVSVDGPSGQDDWGLWGTVFPPIDHQSSLTRPVADSARKGQGRAQIRDGQVWGGMSCQTTGGQESQRSHEDLGHASVCAVASSRTCALADWVVRCADRDTLRADLTGLTCR